MSRRMMGWIGAAVVLGLVAPRPGRAQTLGDTTAAMGTHSTLAGTSAGNPAATLGTVKSHLSSGPASSGSATAGSDGWAKAGGQSGGGSGSHASSRGWASSTDHAGSGWAKAGDQRTGSSPGAGWAKASDRRGGSAGR